MIPNSQTDLNLKPSSSDTAIVEQIQCMNRPNPELLANTPKNYRHTSARRSWLKCVQLALPELRILLGVLLICSAFGTLWIQYRGEAAEASLNAWQAPVTLTSIAILAFSPPLVFGFRSCQQQWRAISALLGLGWRNAVLLIALVCLIQSRAGEDFLLSSGLVACYFPLLALESWLLTRQAKRLCLDASLI